MFLINVFELIGQMVILLMLIIFGVVVGWLYIGSLGWLVLLFVVKVIICVGCGVVVGLWFNLELIVFGVLVL